MIKEYKGYRDLKVYQLAFSLAVEIFNLTKSFLQDERYSLVDQIRRSSRSVSTNIAEAWYKRKYSKAFINKLIDSAGEAGETEVWIDFSFEFRYINEEQKKYYPQGYAEIGKMLNSMINQPEKFCH
jgi:four helix bundle protein